MRHVPIYERIYYVKYKLKYILINIRIHHYKAEQRNNFEHGIH